MGNWLGKHFDEILRTIGAIFIAIFIRAYLIPPFNKLLEIRKFPANCPNCTLQFSIVYLSLIILIGFLMYLLYILIHRDD